MIFTITSLRHENDSLKHSRCFGYYTDYDKAVTAVVENRCDLHEAYYTYLVIEQVPEGIHPIAKLETWFKYDLIEMKWLNCLKPEIFRKFKGFSIG